MKKTFPEQIKDLEATRAAKAARQAEIMQKTTDEGRSTDTAEAEEFDTLDNELKSIDGDLVRLQALEKHSAGRANPVAGGNADDAARARGGAVVNFAPANVAKGIQFARVVKCIAFAKGNLHMALEIASRRYANDKHVVAVVKAAVEAGSTADGNWAAALVGDETSVFADFVEFLRPTTILGKFGAGGVPSLRQVPFRVPLITQTTGGSGYWVGEGKAKPLTKFGFTRTTLEPLKVANIAVLTMESLRDSSPSSEALVRDELAAALRERMDIDFIDPTKAASAGVSPASILNGVTPIVSTGNDADNVRQDLRALFEAFIAANNAPTSGVFVMSSLTALALSLMVNALGQREFPNIGIMGGTLNGLPVITSEYMTGDTDGGWVALINAQDVYLGDDGGINIDASREASLEMSDAPAHDSVTPTAAQLVSMFQTNSVAIKAERTINWMKRRTSAAAYLSSVNWGDPAS